MKLSANFTLDEMTKSQTASRKGISNNPSAKQIDNIKELCMNVLQPIRSYYDKPVFISSGYRSPELCIAIGSKIDSQHTANEGAAADIEIMGIDNKELADYIINNLEYDQIILEYYEGGNSGWVHVSYNSKDNRKNKLKAFRDEETQRTKYIPY